MRRRAWRAWRQAPPRSMAGTSEGERERRGARAVRWLRELTRAVRRWSAARGSAGRGRVRLRRERVQAPRSRAVSEQRGANRRVDARVASGGSLSPAGGAARAPGCAALSCLRGDGRQGLRTAETQRGVAGATLRGTDGRGSSTAASEARNEEWALLANRGSSCKWGRHLARRARFFRG